MKKLILLFLLFLPLIGNASEFHKPPAQRKARILLGSPVRQKPGILREFLESLSRLEKQSFTFDYYFVDDNTIDESRHLLESFSEHVGPGCYIVSAATELSSGPYSCNEHTHYWTEDAVWKVAGFKEGMIRYAQDNGYDYLFLIDSDLVLHPLTIERLLETKKDIVANIFWTKWDPYSAPLPQVWVSDMYNLYEKGISEQLSTEEVNERTNSFLNMLKNPGTYEVGGLGACTLISKAALNKGISFKRIKNTTIWGEDRHFCIRAVALGLSLFVDTHYPAYHIYRESELAGVEKFIQDCSRQKAIISSPRITLAMVMKNEAGRYLRRVLEDARQYITDAVIIDDASTDNSVQVCKQVLQGIPLHLVRNSESKFSNEVSLRKQLWEEVVKQDPEWILILDADEVFERRFKNEIKNLVLATDVDAYYFRLYDFWNETHYREDGFWRAHLNYYPFLIRYKPQFNYQWRETPQHCGRFPYTVVQFPKRLSDMRIKHFGWAKPEDRLTKFERYQLLDPGAKYGWREQYDSILDETPHLVAWVE